MEFLQHVSTFYSETILEPFLIYNAYHFAAHFGLHYTLQSITSHCIKYSSVIEMKVVSEAEQAIILMF